MSAVKKKKKGFDSKKVGLVVLVFVVVAAIAIGAGYLLVNNETFGGGFNAMTNDPNISSGGSSGKIKVVRVKGVKTKQETISMYVDDSASIGVYITPSNATNKNFTCASSNVKIATVKVNGNSCVVKGVKAGTVTITVTTTDGNKKTTVKVQVLHTIKISSISFPSSTHSMFIGTTSKLETTIKPDNASNQNVVCSSSNTMLATVNSSGRSCIVSAKAKGTVIITATAYDGKKASVAIVISVPVSKLAFRAATTSIKKGDSVKLQLQVTPSNATNKKVNCISSNTKIATVKSGDGYCIVKGVNKGAVTINATAADKSGKSATAKVIVK